MIRATTLEDTEAILALAVAAGLFPSDGTEELASVLAGSFDGSLGDDHIWVTDAEDRPVAAAYYAPERMAEGTWNLYMIAVHPDHQRQGRGAALISHVEESLRARGARLLLVETSSLSRFEPTQAFYKALDFEEEARIRDFYHEGEDKVIFRKHLT